MKTLPGKIIIIDDQEHEKTLLEEALLEKQWSGELEYFSLAEDAIEYLKKTEDKIFLIICDINLPKMNGLEMKKDVDKHAELSKKAIPFIFLSTAATRDQVTEAYAYRVQGYFQKAKSVDEQADMLDKIINYWIINQHPHIEKIPAIRGL